MASAEQAIIARSQDGVREHDIGTGWHVIVAKLGERHATWYFHANDDKRIAAALRREAERRFDVWSAREAEVRS